MRVIGLIVGSRLTSSRDIVATTQLADLGDGSNILFINIDLLEIGADAGWCYRFRDHAVTPDLGPCKAKGN